MAYSNDTEFDPNADQLFIEPPSWPKVVGIISICFGALGLGCVGCGAISILVFIPMAESQMNEPLPPPMVPGALQYGLIGLGFLLNALLIIAGVLAVTRNPVTRMLHLAWALAGVVVTLASTYFQYAQQQAIARWIADNPDSQWAQQPGQGGAVQMITLAVGLVMGLAWPIFCLIWFGVVKTRASQMTGQADDDHDPLRPEPM